MVFDNQASFVIHTPLHIVLTALVPTVLAPPFEPPRSLLQHSLWEAIADLSHCKELRDNFLLTKRLPKDILESFVPPQQPDVRVDSQQLIGPPAAAADQPSKYDQRNRQYLA